jgi:hypothetical protein
MTPDKIGGTVLDIRTEMGGLSPLEFWDFWCRPFAQDFADHLVARLTGTPDPSTYGRLTRRSLARRSMP